MRVGILLPRFNENQLAYECIRSVNAHIYNNLEDDYVLFYENVANFPLTPLCAAMTVDEICLYNDGVIISTNMDNLESTIKTVNTSHKVLYLADIEWIRPYYNRNYKQNLECLKNTTLIARSERHAHILRNYSGMPVSVMRDFNVPEIVRQVKEAKYGEETTTKAD